MSMNRIILLKFDGSFTDVHENVGKGAYGNVRSVESKSGRVSAPPPPAVTTVCIT